MSDHDQLVPLIDGIKDTLGRTPEEASADGGYCSEAALAALVERDVSTASAKQPDQVMRDKLKWTGWRSRYSLRKQIVDLMFGQIKEARGSGSFVARVRESGGQMGLGLHAHNLTKLAQVVLHSSK